MPRLPLLSPRMSSALLPTTRAASGPEIVVHLSMIAVWVASLGNAVRDTRWFTAVERSRMTSPLRVLMTRSVSVTTWPYEAALVTRRGLPAGSGMEQVYGWCVWPVTIASTSADIALAMATIGPEMPTHCW